MINIEIKFNDGKKLTNLIRYIQNPLLYGEAQSYMSGLADLTVNDMREVISTSKKRPSTGKTLENAIDKEFINTVGGIDIGIGNIGKLNVEAPYWEVLNNGGYVPYSTVKGAPLGSFDGDYSPIPGASGQNWERGNGSFFMKPKSPIEGIDYIGKSLRNLDRNLIKYVESIGGKLIDGMERSGKGTYVTSWGKNVNFYKEGGVDMG